MQVEKERSSCVVSRFIDLPDLVILQLVRYLSAFDAIQAFYNVDSGTDRIVNLLIEARCFSTIHHLRLPLFTFVCDHILPQIGSRLSHLTLYDHQLELARRKEILSILPNLFSLHLIDILFNNDLHYFLNRSLYDLTIEFASEHHIETQTIVCEQFIFHKRFNQLHQCHLSNRSGIQLQHLILATNYSIRKMTIQLKTLPDLLVLFDHLPNVTYLNVEIHQWNTEDLKYDYSKLPFKLSHLTEFSLKTEHALTFYTVLTIIRHLIHLRILSFIYRNYDEHGIDIDRFASTLTHLIHLTQLNFIIKFVYFHLHPKLTFDNYPEWKQRWHVYTHINTSNKTYLAYTQPFRDRNYTISMEETIDHCFPSVTDLHLVTHSKTIALSSIVHSLDLNFPSVTHLYLNDSFVLSDDDLYSIQLPRIHSFDAGELKNTNVLNVFLRSMPNLIRLRVTSDILSCCDLPLNTIKNLHLINDTLNSIIITNILSHLPVLEQLTIDMTKKQANRSRQESNTFLVDWFRMCSRLFRIHIQARQVSDLVHFSTMSSNQTMNVQYRTDMITVWR